MDIRTILIFTALAVLFACGENEDNGQQREEDKPDIDRSEKGVIRATPEEMPDLGEVDADFLSFWSPFRDAVEKEARALVMGMVELPLYGAGHLSLQDETEALISDEFRYFYFRIIDEAARRKISRMKMKDIPYVATTQDADFWPIAEELGIPIGSRVYYLMVEDPSSTGRGTTFYFARTGRGYKLAWVDMHI